MSLFAGRVLTAAMLFLALPVPAASDMRGDGPVLTLTEAQSLAHAHDAGRAGALAQARALHEDATADAQLPDPELRAGIENVPVDHPSRSRDNMTMTTLGVAQRFPPPGTLAARGAQGRARADTQQARTGLRELDTARAVRTAYIEVAESEARTVLLDGVLTTAGEREALLRGGYAGGDGTQQAVLESTLETLRARERVLANAGARQEARARLARWIGPDARRPLSAGLPGAQELPEPPAQSVPPTHPVLQTLDAGIAGARGQIALAHAAYRPEFVLEGRYGERAAHDSRGRELPDMASVMVSMSVPWFTAQRQDRRLAAARSRLAAARHARTDGARELQAQLDAARARAAQIESRLALYDAELLTRAGVLEDSAAATVAAGTLEPAAVAGARLTRLELELDRLALAAEALRVRAQLAYLGGR